MVEKLSTGTTKTWYHVITESGKYGYVVSSDVAAYVSSGDSLTAGIVAVTADLMASAASEGERVKWSVPQHCPLVVISSKTDTDGKLWYRVGLTIDNIRYIGYLPEKAVTRMYMERYYRTFAETVSLYSKPSASSSIIKTYAANTQLRIAGIVTDASGTDWYAVRAGSVYGYLKGSLVSEPEKLLLSRRNREKVEEGVPGLDKHIFKFYGRSDKDKKRTKKLAISGKKGDTFLVNAWGKGTPLPETDNDKKRRFGVEVVFVASDGTEDVHYTNFSPDILDWQFLSDVYVAKKAYTSVKVSYTYCHQANTAYFDGLALFKEEFGQTYTYDDDNNVISVVDSQSNKQKFEYNSTNDMTGVTDAKGNSFKYKYDDNHRVIKGTSAQGVVYMFEYDKESGNVKKSGAVNPSDTAKGTWQTRTFTTDKNHVASVTDAEENTVEYSWNLKKDILNSMKDANGNVLSYAYDDLKRLTEVSQSATVNGAKKTVSNTYKYNDERLSSITHNGFDYGFVYDGFGNTSAVSIAGTEVIGHKYASRNGNLTKTTYGNGAYIRYVYDAQDRVKESYYSDSSSGGEALLDSYVYDKQGNLVQVTNHPSGKTYHLSYDFLDRLMRTRDEEGNLCEYKYDANNQMTRMRHTHTTASGNTYYTYDKDGREATVRAASTATRTTSYDSLGRVKNQQWADADGTVFDSVSYSYPSSGDNCSTRPNVMKLGSRKLTYTYDGNGNITAITDSAGDMTASYVYDERNQLIRENSKDQGKTFVYAYDAGGNLTSIKEYAYTTGTLGSVVKTIKGTYSSKWKDQLTKWNGESITYDAIGNMLTHGDTSYTWTQGRKLASVVKKGVTSKYLYDHTGMRVSKTVDGVETRYRYAGRLLLSEKTTGGKTLFFRYDSASNLISMTYNSNVYIYVKNLQGDIIGLVNTAGEMVVEYKYDAWGKVLEISGSLAGSVGEKNPFRYREYYYDSETEMYYLQSRYYDPEVKRFINADDRLSRNYGSVMGDNIYIYCNNNSINMKDTTGHMPNFVLDLGKKVCNYGKKVLQFGWAAIKSTKVKIGYGMGMKINYSVNVVGMPIGVSVGGEISDTATFSYDRLEVGVQSSLGGAVTIGDFYDVGIMYGNSHSFSNSNCVCDVKNKPLVEQLNCPVHMQTSKIENNIGISAGVYFILGGELSLYMDLDDLEKYTIEIFSE